MIANTGDLFFPLYLSKYFLGNDPIPYQAWLSWHHHHAETFTRSRNSTDPFPDGVLT